MLFSNVDLHKNTNIGNIQYKGCKRKISYELLEQMHKLKPYATTFIDVFVSEYTQPANTKKIFSIKKEKVFNSAKNKSFVEECLFVNSYFFS